MEKFFLLLLCPLQALWFFSLLASFLCHIYYSAFPFDRVSDKMHLMPDDLELNPEDREERSAYSYQKPQRPKSLFPLKTKLIFWSLVAGGITVGTFLFLFFLTIFIYFFLPLFIILTILSIFRRLR
jgi:hypothetical protein